MATPFFPILDAVSLEAFEWPTPTLVPWLALNAALALAFNVGLLLSVACLSPLTTSMGCLLTMPLSSLVDFVWHGIEPHWGDAVGALLIALGFGLLVRADRAAGGGGSPPQPKGSPGGPGADRAMAEADDEGDSISRLRGVGMGVGSSRDMGD